jgi:hypothetical protein
MFGHNARTIDLGQVWPDSLALTTLWLSPRSGSRHILNLMNSQPTHNLPGVDEELENLMAAVSLEDALPHAKGESRINIYI